jgi:uncharacterized repeat protein (TIGR01451 family)
MRPLAHHFRFALAVAWLAALPGCAIPAIDPTGRRIFSGTTRLAACDWIHGHKHGEAAAATQPVCAPPVEVVPVAPPPRPLAIVPLAPSVPVMPVACGPQQMIVPGVPPRAGPVCEPEQAPCVDRGPQLKITPSRIVAPVNSEVILAAGICGPNGYYITRQPIEWMLNQDGVGQIVAVGKESPNDVSFLLRNSPQKVATNYARAHTSTISQVLDRGTKNPGDDVCLDKGQSWISVTSPTEGATHVVVWAPKECNWERRKETATIYWVDAAWQFPPSIAARAGARTALTTTVVRSAGEPLAGWIVRYEVLDGPPASFSARGERAVEVRTDAAGRATAELLPGSIEPGITTVGIQVIRPSSGRGELGQMVVGQGMTSVSWSAPGLSVRAVGTGLVASDGTVSYRVEVTNSGDLPTRGVTLTYTPPTGVTVLNSTPAAQVFGQRYEWRLGDLPGRTTAAIEMNGRAAVAASIRSTFTARSSDGLVAEGSATTEVFANTLSVKMSGPEAVEVGREAKFQIDVTNTGTRALTNITATDTFDPGLQHLQGERSPLVRSIAQLGPGQTERFAVTFIVTRPGQQCHRLDVTAEGGHAAAARGCVTGTQPAAPPPTPARLSVRVTGPRTIAAGQVGEFFVDVTNTGTAAASGVVIQVQYGVNLELKEATGGHKDDPRNFTTTWRVAQLAGGESIRRQLNCRALNADPRATVKASVTSDQNRIAEIGQTVTEITAAAAPPPVRPGVEPVPEAPVAGNLKVVVRDLADPIMLGAKTTYLIQITNQRAAADHDVAITLQLSEGLKVTGIAGPTGAANSSPDGRTVELTPVAEIRANEQLPDYKVEVEGTKAGKQKLQVIVKSARTPAGVTAEAETTVNMP